MDGYLFLHACISNYLCENRCCWLHVKKLVEKSTLQILLTDVASYWMLLALLERFIIISIHHKAHHSREQK